MNFAIPAIGLVSAAFILAQRFRRSKSTTTNDERASHRVDFDELIANSAINKRVSSPPQIPNTSASNRTMNANIVKREFERANIPFGIMLGALVNAQYESRMTAALGDDSSGTPHAFGLFQLNTSGAGRGMSRSDMLDPVINTQTIIQDYQRNGSPIRSAYETGASVATVAGLFGKYIERPADRETTAASKRAKYARELFPSIAHLPAEDLYT